MSQPRHAWGRGAVANPAADADPPPSPEIHQDLRPPGASTSRRHLPGGSQPTWGEGVLARQVEPSAGRGCRLQPRPGWRAGGRAGRPGRRGGGRKASPVQEAAAARPRRPAPASPSRLHSAPRPRPAGRAELGTRASGPGSRRPHLPLSPRRGASAPQAPAAAAAFRPAPRSLRVRNGAGSGAGLWTEPPPPPPPSSATPVAATALVASAAAAAACRVEPGARDGPGGRAGAKRQANRCARRSASAARAGGGRRREYEGREGGSGRGAASRAQREPGRA